MTLVTMVWALKEAPVPNDPIAHLVLIGLADHAHDDGTEARPSVATLAKYARCSPRTVHNKLRILEQAGLIRRGDQQTVAHLRADRRPVVYDLIMKRGVYEMHPAETVDNPFNGVHDVQGVNVDGVNGQAPRGERSGVHGVNACADRTTHEPLEGRGGAQANTSPVDNPEVPPLLEETRIHPDRCAKHQNVDVPPPCGGCADARKAVEAKARREAEQAAVAERERREHQRSGARCTVHSWRPAGMCTDCAGEHKGGMHATPVRSCHLCPADAWGTEDGRENDEGGRYGAA